MRSLNSLAWHNLKQHRLRSALSVFAVALGAAMTVAADLVGRSILNSLAGSEDAHAFSTGLIEYLGSTLTAVGVVITAAAGFLVFNAFAMSITQRRQQIGLLRSLGMSRGCRRGGVMRLVLIEAGITGGLGTLAGLIAGPLFGQGTIVLMKAIVGEDMFTFSASAVSPSSLLLAAVLGVGITVLSALIPAWQAARVSPLAALRRQTDSDHLRSPISSLRFLLTGLLIVVALVIYLVAAPPGEWVYSPVDILLTCLFALLWLGGLVLILPALIGGVGRWLRSLLARFGGASGRLVADNVRRGRGRVTLTILTLALGLALIVGLTGFMSFTFNELMAPRIEASRHQRAWMLMRFDVTAGMSAYSEPGDLLLSPELVAAARELVDGRASVVEWNFVIVPELAFFGPSYFSLVMDPGEVRQAGEWVFEFSEGDWESAMPVMEQGCGVLVTPMIASNNGVSLGETFEVTGGDGPVECTVAGIGSTYVCASIISDTAAESFGATTPVVLLVTPLPGVDRDELEADLVALLARHGGGHLAGLEKMADMQSQMVDVLPAMLNALLLLATVSAALGVVNTTVMGVAERRRELGLLRAVGGTRRQVQAVIMGEAALMGLIGGALGFIAGAGVIVIIVVAYGGNAWGIPGLDLWGAAWRSVLPALQNGLVGLVVAPLICAGAAWLPARAALRESPIETLRET